MCTQQSEDNAKTTPDALPGQLHSLYHHHVHNYPVAKNSLWEPIYSGPDGLLLQGNNIITKF